MPTASVPRWLLVSFIILSLLGFADSAYLTAKHYLRTPLPCFITVRCDVVTNSVYATVGPIPVALLGALYYLTIFILAAYALWLGSQKTIRLAAFLTPLGLLASLYFVYIQLFVLHAICIYCVVSAISSTLLFILGMLFLRQQKLKQTISAI